jgi:hypothetical protein
MAIGRREPPAFESRRSPPDRRLAPPLRAGRGSPTPPEGRRLAPPQRWARVSDPASGTTERFPVICSGETCGQTGGKVGRPRHIARAPRRTQHARRDTLTRRVSEGVPNEPEE